MVEQVVEKDGVYLPSDKNRESQRLVLDLIGEYRKVKSQGEKDNYSSSWHKRCLAIKDELFLKLLEFYLREEVDYNRLCDHLKKIDVEAVIQEIASLREKYQLPDKSDFVIDDVVSLNNRWKKLESLAEKNGIKVRPISEGGLVFPGEYLAFYSPLNKGIYADFDSARSQQSVHALEHELVHSLQDQRHPDMSLAQQEYEAHMAGAGLYRDLSGNDCFSVDAFWAGWRGSLVVDLVLDFEGKHQS
ncbi:MAG: hypothetical protein PHX72_01075 [Candidatus Shapirobacteria bacterium]|nr:hypothetical protein [Candidatus Shapirobacteria bacterium]